MQFSWLGSSSWNSLWVSMSKQVITSSTEVTIPLNVHVLAESPRKTPTLSWFYAFGGSQSRDMKVHLPPAFTADPLGTTFSIQTAGSSSYLNTTTPLRSLLLPWILSHLGASCEFYHCLCSCWQLHLENNWLLEQISSCLEVFSTSSCFQLKF